jgi:hypothetical protein
LVRRGLTWLLVLPVIVVGSQVAHGLAYWWAYPNAHLRVEMLADTGHSYLAFAPVVLGFLAAVEVIAFAAVVGNRMRGCPAQGVPPWAFLLIPQLGFLIQEHLERLLASGVFPWWTVLEPSFWRAAVLQVPLGLAACLIARLLLRTASAVADALVERRPARVSGRDRLPARRSPASVLLQRLAPLAGLAADRAPPLPAR